MRYEREDPGYDRVATLDIETTHYKANQGEVVSVGIGIYDAADDEFEYNPFHRESPDDEASTISRALEYVDQSGADGLVTYNGRDFDLEFLNDRLVLCGENGLQLGLDTPETHVDLLEDRKKVCERTGQKWPKLEACLSTYGFDEPETIWNGQPVTNVRFGEELGPEYLTMLEMGDETQTEQLCEVIDHYLVTDLEANLAIYYSDIGADFDPVYLGSRKAF